MAEPTRRMMMKGLPLVAGAGVVLNSVDRFSLGGEPDSVSPQSSAKKKVVAGNSPNYSRTVAFDRMMFVSGVLGVDPDSKKLPPDFEGQCLQVLKNLQASLEAGGSTLANVLKCTCFLVEAGDFEKMNKIYREFFAKDPPARSTVVVKELVMSGAKVEIECIAHL